jgi:acyl-CoA synthetase (AMP-forming)/AMP-acid ligase II
MSASTRETLASVLTAQARDRTDRVFVSFPDSTHTYGEFAERAHGVARGLLAAGLRPGGHVGILMPNCVDYLELLFPEHLAGGVAVPINARFRRRELGFVLAHSDVEMLVTTDLVDEFTDFTALIEKTLPDLADHPVGAGELHLAAAPRLRRIHLHGSRSAPGVRPLVDLVAEGAGVDGADVRRAWSARSAEDTALILYTSGTTADPKGCEITHDALIRSWSAYADLVGFGADQAMWTPCPFFHVGGIGVTVSALVRGATMMSMGHFAPAAALDHIEAVGAEHLFPAFPPLTLGLLRAPEYSPERLGSVRTVLNVAPADTQRVIEKLLPASTVLLTDFGMTEGAGMITATPLDATDEDRLERNGTPLPGIEVRVTDPEDPAAVLPPGTPGEIRFRGINAFRRYYKDPQATAATILEGGWVRTGDLGRIDEEGFLFIVDRA